MEPETVEDVLALLKERPDDAELFQLLGGLYFKRGCTARPINASDLQEAWQAYMQALKLNPDDLFTCLYFGNMLTMCNDKKYALELYEHAVKLDPDLAVAHWCKANLHRSQGEFDLAGQEYEKAVMVDPNDEQALAKLSEWREFIASVRGS